MEWQLQNLGKREKLKKHQTSQFFVYQSRDSQKKTTGSSTINNIKSVILVVTTRLMSYRLTTGQN